MTGSLYGRFRKQVLGMLRHCPRLRLLVRKLYWAVRRLGYRRKYRQLPTEAQTVLFESYGGRSLSCSPKALFDAMCSQERFAAWRFIWSIKSSGEGDAVFTQAFFEHVPVEQRRLEYVIRGSREYWRACSQAAYWIVNTRMPEWVEPKPEQVYVQCWHGSPLKRLGFDVEVATKAALNTGKELSLRFHVDAKKWDFLLSPSAYASACLLSAFGARELSNVQVVEEGYPRNDRIAVAQNAENAEKEVACLKGRIGIPAHKKALLYAPTWRDSKYQAGLGYIAQNELDFAAMAEQLSDTWVLLMRTHYYIENNVSAQGVEDFVLDVSRYPDINELYLVADALLTDYSSVLFDYANTQKPTLYFWPDFEEYRDTLHGFYFDPRKLPGPKCYTAKDVIKEILHIETWDERFGRSYEAFKSYYCGKDDGKASERVIQKVFAPLSISQRSSSTPTSSASSKTV